MIPGYNDQTMWGPQGDPNSPRKRLVPGDRLADGTVYKGDDPESALVAELQRILGLMQPLELRVNGILAKLHELVPGKYPQPIEGELDQVDWLARTRLTELSPIGESERDDWPAPVTIMGRPPDPAMGERMRAQFDPAERYPSDPSGTHYDGPPLGAPPPPPTAEQLAAWAEEDKLLNEQNESLIPAAELNQVPPDLLPRDENQPAYPEGVSDLPISPTVEAPLTPVGEAAAAAEASAAAPAAGKTKPTAKTQPKNRKTTSG